MSEDKRKFVEWLHQTVKQLPRSDQPGNGREPIPIPIPFGNEPDPLTNPYYDPETQRRIGNLISRIADQRGWYHQRQ